MSSSRPTAAVYRSTLLPYSETFVLAQARGLRRYRSLLVGQRQLPEFDASDERLILSTGERLAAPNHAAALLRPSRPALIHAHFAPDAIEAAPIAAALDIPLVATVHGFDVARHTGLRAGPRQWRYGRRLLAFLRTPTTIVAVSDHIRELLLSRGADPQRVHRLHIGVDRAAFPYVPLDGRSSRDVLAIGRLVEKKGFADLLRAFRMVSARHPDATLTILGDGPLRSELSRLAGPDDRVALVGAQPVSEVRELLARAAVLAVPSVTARDGDTEGLPTVVIEAMASGTPVVGTRHAGIPEAVIDGRTGRLVPERSPRALADALVGLLDDPDARARMGLAATERAEQRFCLSAQTAKLEALYDEAIAAHRAGR
jgi:colanic acid/amylovoran biosynthesis glycosyltransferase